MLDPGSDIANERLLIEAKQCFLRKGRPNALNVFLYQVVLQRFANYNKAENFIK